MQVLKFGGTSVANSKNIALVKEIVSKAAKETTVVVVSALGGVTDLLIEGATFAANQDKAYALVLKKVEDRHIKTVKELIPVKKQSAVLSKVKAELNTLETLLEGAFLIGEITPKLSDKIVSYGELLSSFIISEYFISKKMNAVYKDSRELLITNEAYGKAAVNFKKTDKNCRVGRGGSDYSAAIIAAAIKAKELQIWTDVSGMYTANPKIVKQAKAIQHISYQEAMELSHFGAKVLYAPTIQPVLAKNIDILIKNTFAPEAEGTLITKTKNKKGKTVRGIKLV